MSRFVLPVVTEKLATGRTGSRFYLHFYDGYSGSSYPAYEDNGLTQALSNPVESDEYGNFPDIFLASLQSGYRVELRDSAGVLLWNKSEVFGSLQQPSDIGAKRGVVWLFYGTSNELNALLADGWSKADGTAGFLGDTTPDLTGYFTKIVGTAADLTTTVAGSSTVTLSGTVAGHALTVDEIPSHTHAVGESKWVHQLDQRGNQDNNRPVNFGNTTNEKWSEHISAGGDQTHTHTLTFDAYSTEPEYIEALPIIYGY